MRAKHSGVPHWLGAKWAVPHSARWHKHSHAWPMTNINAAAERMVK
jgi:hypothetical protein